MSRTPEPCAMVIFGGSGDLTRRKLIPALASLSQSRLIPGGFTILGVSRSEMTDDQYRNTLHDWVVRETGSQIDLDTWEHFSRGIVYLSGNYHQPEIYARLKMCLSEFDQRRGTEGNRLFYLATPPSDYPGIIENLGAAGLAQERTNGSGWVRIIVEKPFGNDLQSARALQKTVASVFMEDQVYRIDHYLGKETVQNILVFRFANGIFEPIWNRHYVDNVQITAAENIGVGSRGGYYEQAGALRDMIQNHMMQLLTLVGMEPPPNFDPNSVRDEKVKLVHSVRHFSKEDVRSSAVRGQYGPGFVDGERVAGYRQEKDVAADSHTETFAAIRMFIDNWRWAGVPFYLRTGKSLAKRTTEIDVIFRRTPHFIFRQSDEGQVDANVLALRIQPDERITLKFMAKLPGQSMNVRPVNMDFRYVSTFGHMATAYERLLLDCMLGDPTLFDRIDSVLASWTLVQPFFDVWSEKDRPIPIYPAGSWGPPEADELLARDNRRWRLL